MNIIDKFNQYRRYRNTVSELNRLTDRELSDLGIPRYQIRSIARSVNR